MTNLTDEEIVKSLEVCMYDGNGCTNCPCYIKEVSCVCSSDTDGKTVLNLINRLKHENEKFHTLTDLQEANVNIMHENTMKLRKEIEQCEERVSAAYELGYKESKSKFEKEIERLKEENFVLYRDRFTQKELDDISACRAKKATAELQKQVEKLDLANYELEKQIADLKIELQKQVDELETTNGQAMAYIEGLEYELKQAVKDTAKEIFREQKKFICSKWKQYMTENELIEFAEERYGVEVE